MSGPVGMVDRLTNSGYYSHDVRILGGARWETATVTVLATELPALRQAFPGVVVGVTRVSQPYREVAAAIQNSGIDVPDPLYRTPAEVLAALQAIEASNPAIARVYDLQSRYGAPFTHDGNRIYVLRLSDNPAVDEDEPNMLLFGNNHSRELNSIEAPIDAAQRLVAGYGVDPVLTDLVNDNQIWVLPNMNPDGLDYVWNFNDFWRKNRRNNGNGTFGVDLNRNYAYAWGQCGSSSRTSSDTYRGPASMSEPESQAMQMFTATEGLERMIDIHSFGRDVRLPFNPLVRPNVPSFFTDAYDTVHGALGNAMNYTLRGTCCCGTHMEWHHATNGTLGLLIEMGGAFQPPFGDTQVELVRMWPGLREFMTQPVPLRGHVYSMNGRSPLAAEITVVGAPLVDGQLIRSVGRFGRYSLWGGYGQADVTFSAPGHRSKTVSVLLTQGATAELDVELEPIMAPTTLVGSGAPRIGQTVTLNVSSPDDAGAQYYIAPSFFATPTIPLGCREIPLAATELFGLGANAPSVFSNFFSTLDGNGDAQAAFIIPNLTSLIGVDFHFAPLTFNSSFPFFIKGIGDRVTVRISN